MKTFNRYIINYSGLWHENNTYYSFIFGSPSSICESQKCMIIIYGSTTFLSWEMNEEKYLNILEKIKELKDYKLSKFLSLIDDHIIDLTNH